MVQGAGLVEQQPRGAVVVGNHNVNCAIVVNIAEGRSTAYFGEGQSRPGDSGHLSKFLSVAFIAK